jgi:phosphatidylinositol alpha-1,6-mannosyltransferase
LPRVLFVSKPIAAPFHDGTKCLVRDVASSLTQFEPVVLTTPQALGALPPGVRGRAAYSGTGGFTPALADNARAALSVLVSREELWHFVFAPNPRTGLVGRTLRRLRRVPVVQTLASAPRHFSGLKQLLFGDELVVQSRATEERLVQAASAEGLSLPPISVIPPPVPPLTAPSVEACARARADLDVGPNEPLILYPGDLEVSSGAEMTRRLVAPLIERFPNAIVVFAYRQKTPAAAERAAALRAALGGQRVRFSDRVANMHALLATSTLVLFPVDDLWGKVDQPIVLLEALALGTPCLVLDQGPLRDVVGAMKVATLDEHVWLESIAALLGDREHRAHVIGEGRRAADSVYASRVVARAYEGVYLRSLDARR